MFEFMLCSMLTILPDFLFRRFVQGKRIGHEITLYSMWFELRWGITLCAMLTITLITVIFYYHPSTSTVSSYFRTVTILPETPGRVAEVYVENEQELQAGDPIFRMDDSAQVAALEAARAKVREIDAAILVAQAELAAANGALEQADGALEQAQDELDTRRELMARNSNVVSTRDIEKIENVVAERQGAVDQAIANREAVRGKLTILLPAQRKAAEAAMVQADVELDKTLITAGVHGIVEQFVLQPGDYVSSVLRPAGILVPLDAYHHRFQAGFNQISAQVIQPGMLGEITCVTNPLKIIPMRVVNVQDVIAAGQIRPTDQLIDVAQQPVGTVTVMMEPLYEGQADHVPPGSRCVANVYTSNHHKLEDPSLTGFERAKLHVIDTVGIMHALLLRVQALLLPMKTLVFTGHH
ncbi:MAG: biotin/lipoyl-binding protein [Mangrovicoccus sp.]|nr:biotin/lipoyl-binding protein [Mangrovicoccus sp.]